MAFLLLVLVAACVPPSGPLLFASAHGFGAWTALQPGGVSPPSRVYHSGAAVGDAFYVTGGAAGAKGGNNTVYYDAATNRWVSQPQAQLPHDAQIADMDASGGALYLFGGRDTINPDPVGSGVLNHLYVLRTSLRGESWKAVPTPNAPSARNGHSMVAAAGGALMVVFGGWDQSRYFDDTWGLSVTELILRNPNDRPYMWTRLDPAADDPAKPAARNSHTMVSVGHELLLFGGFSHNIAKSGPFTSCAPDDQCVFYDDLWSLRLPAKFDDAAGNGIEWRQLTPAGSASRPVGRWWHAAESIGDYMYVFGGLDRNGAVLSDVWSYATNANTWRQLASKKDGGMYGASSGVIGGSIYFYGGYTKSGWAGLSSALVRFDTPTMLEDDDGEPAPGSGSQSGPSGSKGCGSDGGSGSGNNAGTTAGIVILVLLNLVLLGFQVAAWRRQRRDGTSSGGVAYVGL